MKQIQLFNGVVIPEASEVIRACVVKHIQNPGEKKVNAKGKERLVGVKDVTTVQFLPRTAGEGKQSLATVFPDHKGQGLMAFEVQKRAEVAEAVLKDLSGKIMSGEYVFGAARLNNRNGNYDLKFKRAAVRIVRDQVTEEQACKALGITPEQLAAIKAAGLPVPASAAKGSKKGDVVETLQLKAA